MKIKKEYFWFADWFDVIEFNSEFDLFEDLKCNQIRFYRKARTLFWSFKLKDEIKFSKKMQLDCQWGLELKFQRLSLKPYKLEYENGQVIRFFE